jgi:hypothetical protein
MFQEPAKKFLYSAYRVETRYVNSAGKEKSESATVFMLEVKPKTALIVTNRGVINLDYRQLTAKYKDF